MAFELRRHEKLSQVMVLLIMGVVYKLSSSRCEQAYIGSSIHTGQHRLKQLRRRKHPIGAYDDVVVETLHSDVAAEDLRRLEGECQRAHDGPLFNKRIAGRTTKQYYQENADEIKRKAKARYVPLKDGGDTYTQLEYYKNNKHKIGRKLAIANARRGCKTTARVIAKYQLTEADLTSDAFLESSESSASPAAPEPFRSSCNSNPV